MHSLAFHRNQQKGAGQDLSGPVCTDIRLPSPCSCFSTAINVWTASPGKPHPFNSVDLCSTVKLGPEGRGRTNNWWGSTGL